MPTYRRASGPTQVADCYSQSHRGRSTAFGSYHGLPVPVFDYARIDRVERQLEHTRSVLQVACKGIRDAGHEVEYVSWMAMTHPEGGTDRLLATYLRL